MSGGRTTGAIAASKSIKYALDGLTPSSAWSASRVLVDGYAGSLFTESSGDVATALDQSGNGLVMTATGTAFGTTTNLGTNGRVSFDLRSGASYFQSTGDSILSDIIDADKGYMIASIYLESVRTNSGSGFFNDAIWGDAGQFVSLNFRSTGNALAYNWDGSADYSPSVTGDACAASSTHVVEWLHTGGNLTLIVDGTISTSVASGNTSDITNVWYLGAGNPASFDGAVFECATFKTIPSIAERLALRNNFLNWIG